MVGGTVRWRRAVRGEERDTDFALLNGGFGGLLDVGPDLADVGGCVGVGGDADGLDEEFVAAFGFWWWVFLHGLQENLHFDVAMAFDAAGVGADAVSRKLSVVCRTSLV